MEFNSTSSEQIYAETVLKSAFTDGGSTSGYLDLAVPIPAGARVLDWQADVRVALSGDTSAVLQVGESGNVDRFSSLTTSSVFVTGVVGSTAPTVSGDPGYCVAAVTPRLTVTSNSDFTNVNTLGQLDVKIRYSSSFRT